MEIFISVPKKNKTSKAVKKLTPINRWGDKQATFGLWGTNGPKFPPKANHRGPAYLLPPKPKPGLLDPLGPLAEVDFLSGFRTPRDGSGLAGRIRTLQNETGPRWMDRKTNKGPARQIRARRTNQGPSRQIRARKTNQGPAGQIRDHGTDQGLAIRIGAPQDGSGPRTSNQGPRDESGPRGTSRAPRDG